MVRIQDPEPPPQKPIDKGRGARDHRDLHDFQQEKVESLSLLAGGVAHDFNNLLMTILGNVDLASEVAGRESSELQGYLREIQEASDRAAELCRQLLAYSGRGRSQFKVIELGQLITDLGERLELAAGNDVTIDWQPQQGLPLVRGNTEELREMLVQLVKNAAEACGEGGRIRIATGRIARRDVGGRQLNPTPDRLHDDLFVEVSDNGEGMSEATRRRVFEPFFTTRGASRGRGLARVFGTVRTHSGWVTIASELGQGTQVRISFPVLSRADLGLES